ncbi:hypothetical protein AMTRI_Chr12g234420 [Amborella trichopoda]
MKPTLAAISTAILSPASAQRKPKNFIVRLNSFGELKIATIMNGLVLIGVVVAMVLLLIEASLEWAECVRERDGLREEKGR